MATFPAGNYVFECGECSSEGQVEVGDHDYGDHEWVKCEHCNGDGELHVGEDEAVDFVEAGATPKSAPPGFSDDDY